MRPDAAIDERGGAFRVDRRAYSDPGLFARERERIWDRCWLYAAHASELREPGAFLARSVGGHPLLIVRGLDGELRAFDNTCTHRGARLCPDARGTATSFRCPYHAWTFDTCGALRGVPGRDRAASGDDLAPVRLEAYRDFLFVTRAADAPPLAGELAGAIEHLDLIADQAPEMEVVPGTQRYTIRANWKLLAENSIDAYHLVALHRRYVEYVRDAGVRITRPEGRALALGNGHAVNETSPPLAGKPVAWWGPPMPPGRRQAVRDLQAELRERHGAERARRIGETYRQLLVFPNLMVIDTVATTIRTWEPAGVDRMTVTAWALAPRGQHPDDRAAALSGFLTFFGPGGFATPDDIAVLEDFQRGLANPGYADMSRGINTARAAFDDELPLRSFWQRWRELLA